MAYTQANLPIQIFYREYGLLDRTYEVFRALQQASAESPAVTISNPFFRGTPFSNGKKRTVKLVFNPINCDDSGSCDDNVCTPGTPQQPTVEDFDITECTASVKFTLNADDLRYVDATDWTFTSQGMALMMEQLPTFRRKLAKAMLQKVYALAGNHADGNQTHQMVNLTNSAGRINPMGILRVNKEYTDLGYNLPVTIGGGDFYYVSELRSIGGLNNDGVQVNRVPFDRAYYDENLAGELFNQLSSGNWAISIAPGTLKLVTFNYNAGMFRTNMGSPEDLTTQYQLGSANFIRGTFYDEGTGFTYDYDAHFDECEAQWTFQYRLEWDIWRMPPIVCNDVIGDVNGIMIWRTCEEVVADCPTGQSLSVPVEEDTYSWTPTLANLASIYQSTIDNWNFVSNGTPIEITTVAELATFMSTYSNTTFTANGADIEYTGISAISASFNNGAVTATFTT